MLEVLGKIGFDWQVALANLVNFIIIFFVLRKFAWGPIQRVLSERQQKIDQGLEDAEKAKGELLMAEEIKSKKIDEAKSEANRVVGDAQTKADSIVSKAETESMDLRSKILKDAEKEASDKKDAVYSEVQKEFSNLVISGVEKVLKENMNPETQKSYIENSLKSFSSK